MRLAAVVHALTAEVWRRAGRFEDALAACAAVDAELGEEADAVPDGDERVGTATVAAFVRNLSIAGDDDARGCAEAFGEG